MDVRGEADPCDRPQKVRSKDLTSSMPRRYSREPRSCKPSLNIAMEKEADSSNRPQLASTCLLPVFSIDLAGNGKLRYGFTAADDLEEIEIGPGDKSQPTFINK